MTNNGKILLAGPWFGEFGWELFCWQGYIRKLSRIYDRTIVIGRPNNEFLYKDFCDEYIPFDPESFITDAWKCKNCKLPNSIIKSTIHDDYISGNFDIGMRYTKNGVVDTKNLFFNSQEFIKYETEKEIPNNFNGEGYDVIFHCRNKITGSDRNWSFEQWCELKKLLGDNIKVACMGNDEAFLVPNTDDIRNISNEDLLSIMNKTKIVVGQSSGPLHFASLCGVKHLVWSTEYNRVRYERDWNPLKTEVIFYSEGEWNPKPSKIKDLILKNIK
jgi:hypothetical protein